MEQMVPHPDGEQRAPADFINEFSQIIKPLKRSPTGKATWGALTPDPKCKLLCNSLCGKVCVVLVTLSCGSTLWVFLLEAAEHTQELLMVS